MEKTINIGNKEVRLNNNVGWAIAYRDQFGHDIISTLTPMLAALLDVTAGILQEAGIDNGSIGVGNILEILDGDRLIDIIAHLSGVEFVDLIYITWAMAKAADDTIPEPRKWVQEFEDFPIDEIAPEVAKLAVKGLVSRKNALRLRNLLSKIKETQPLTSTPLSSQGLSEA